MSPTSILRNLHTAGLSAYVLLCLLAIGSGCADHSDDDAKQIQQITEVLDAFHVAAAEADLDRYFGYFSDNAVFIGTDASERWNKSAFMVWAKPYFDRGKAWSFSAFDRHIIIGEGGSIAWFDELLDTQMHICRGSGVLQRESDGWKIRHYVLSMTVPNEVVDPVVALKMGFDQAFRRTFTEQAK